MYKIVKLHVDPFQNVGYINVDSKRGANLFYWFFEAMNGNASAPVILWLQGGMPSLRFIFYILYSSFLFIYNIYHSSYLELIVVTGPGCSAMMGLFNEVCFPLPLFPSSHLLIFSSSHLLILSSYVSFLIFRMALIKSQIIWSWCQTTIHGTNIIICCTLIIQLAQVRTVSFSFLFLWFVLRLVLAFFSFYHLFLFD